MSLFNLGKRQITDEAQRVVSSGVTSVRDVIAPAALQIEFNYVRLGSYYLRTFFVYSYPRYLYTEWLSPIINADFTIDTSIFIYPISSQEILRKLRTKTAQIESTISEQQQKGLVRDPKLETAYGDVEELRDTLQRGEGKFFKSSLYFTIYAKSTEELDSLTNYLENLLGGSAYFHQTSIYAARTRI